ncbi:CcdB family protein [Oryzisolibacter sp. LB2S]|uniref:CcdB family protein n=1 Tax=Alicycliphilus soli TaxID=3228789 RepID=UPI003458807E
MARFDVYANPDPEEQPRIPFFLDIQSDFIEGLHTRIVVPLWAEGLLSPRAQDLHPTLDVSGQRVVMDTAALGAVPDSFLRRKVDNLSAQQLDIQNALDLLFGGY